MEEKSGRGKSQIFLNEKDLKLLAGSGQIGPVKGTESFRLYFLPDHGYYLPFLHLVSFARMGIREFE